MDQLEINLKSLFQSAGIEQNYYYYSNVISNELKNHSTTLFFSHIKVENCNVLKTILQAIQNTEITSLTLQHKEIGNESINRCIEDLKLSQITHLDLSYNNLGCNGIIYLAQVLKDTRISTLILEKNRIKDKGARYLVEVVKNTHITYLNLRKNKIGSDGANYLNEMLSNSNVRFFLVDIYHEMDNNTYIIEMSNGEINSNKIFLSNNKIGIKGVEYIKKTFGNEITTLKLDTADLDEDDAEHLALAFKDTKIKNLILDSITSHKLCFEIKAPSVHYLIKAFKDSNIIKLKSDNFGGLFGTIYLAEFLKNIRVFDLELRGNFFGDACIKYLAPVLEKSDVMYVDLALNDIQDEGARFLFQALRNSKILSINLTENEIRDDGVKFLLNELPYSQVTEIYLKNNRILNLEHFKNVFNKTTECTIFLHSDGDDSNELDYNLINHDREESNLKMKLRINRVKKSSTTFIEKLTRAYKNLVLLNPSSNKNELKTLEKYKTFDIKDFVFILKTFKDNEYAKSHIIDVLCNVKNDFDINTMTEINEIIAALPKNSSEFDIFIQNQLPILFTSFSVYNYVYLAKSLDEKGLYDYVKKLLLHRPLCYIDESLDILHPYIYILLAKHNMPLYNEQFEPNKKDKIISYYLNHQEIEGAAEVTDLLKSVSL